MKYNPIIFLIALFFIIENVNAIEPYNPKKSYPAGSEVMFNGILYKAKWWANSNQSPGKKVKNSWETPWKPVSKKILTSPPLTHAKTEHKSVSKTADQGIYPKYQSGSKYQAGDIVLNQGKLYRCKTGNTQAWCSGAFWAYAPGTGTAWEHAWESVSNTKADLKKPDPSKPTRTNPLPKAYTITQTELNKIEKKLTNFPEMKAVRSAIKTLNNQIIDQVFPMSSTNPENVKRVEKIISKKDWNYLFPKRAPQYTYRHFLQAIAKFPAFCGTYKDGRDSQKICRKSLATMFAHFTQETGGHTAHWEVPEWRQGLVHVREMGWTEKMRGGYNGECNPKIWQGQTWPCGKFKNGDYKSYFGRGAKQLSYNYNYGPFSDAIFGTVHTLLKKPEMVADTWLNLASAIFFFIYPQPPKPSMLHVIDGTWKPNQTDLKNGLKKGFGVTTQIINGGVECGGRVEIAQSLNRIKYYKHFVKHLDVSIADNEILGCKSMKQFDASGQGALNIYWEKDWSWSANLPDGKAYSCKLVGYQTPFSAFKKGDYTKCVQKHFPDIKILHQ